MKKKFLKIVKNLKKIYHKPRFINLSYNLRYKTENKKRFCLLFKEFVRVELKHMEVAKKILKKKLGKRCKLLFRVFPSVPFSKKPAQVRMGKGTGKICGTFFWGRPGAFFLEVISGQASEKILKALFYVCKKMPCKLMVKNLSDFFI